MSGIYSKVAWLHASVKIWDSLSPHRTIAIGLVRAQAEPDSATTNDSGQKSVNELAL
jgi:hypothetical protein